MSSNPGACTCEASSHTGPRYSSLKMSRDTPRIVLYAFTHSASTLEKSINIIIIIIIVNELCLTIFKLSYLIEK